MRSMKPQFFSIMCFLLMTCVILDAYGDPWKDLQQGDKAAKELAKEGEQKKKEAGPHPFYNGKQTNESKLLHTQLTGKSQQEAQQNAASQMIMESARTRLEFKIDPSKDPLLTGSQKILKDPLKSIGGEGVREVVAPGKTEDKTLTCEEARNPYPQTCTSKVIVSIEKTKTKKEWQGKFQYSKCNWSEPEGHYLPCRALRQAVGRAWKALRGGTERLFGKRVPIDVKAALNITGPYKACIHELNTKKGRSCPTCTASTPLLPFKPEQIKEVSLIKHPQHPRDLQMADSYSHHYKSGRFEYRYHPLIKIVYEEESYKELPDEEEIYCDELEKKVALGLCSYESKICSQGKQTRLIQGVSITRNCWQYTRTYACEYPSKDDCGPLRARGCTQGKSACKTYVGKICVVHTQTYTCKGNSQPKHSIAGGQTPFCLDGNCRNQSWENNDEMMRSLAQLSILKEMQGQLQNGMIFKGEDRRCSRYILNFKDCCGSGKGWGKSIGLGGCSSGEKELSEKRKAGLCHSIGTYCAKKILGKCVKKNSSYCCFNNKLLKAFHVQGRPQIKLGWGEPENPLCRGFTVEELQRIDFSKLDLREVFEDLMKKFQTGKNKSNAQDMGKQIGNRMEIIKKGMLPPNKKQPNQRPDA
jgi:conjugal transfer mating pair stabilization protein TraN